MGKNDDDFLETNHADKLEASLQKRVILTVLISCFVMVAMITTLIIWHGKNGGKEMLKQPEGEQITLSEVALSMYPFDVDMDGYMVQGNDATQQDMAGGADVAPIGQDKEQYLTYRDWIALFREAFGEEVTKNSLSKLENRYLDTHFVVRDDYIAVYADILRNKANGPYILEESFCIYGSMKEMDLEQNELVLTQNMMIKQKEADGQIFSGQEFPSSFYYTDQGFLSITDAAMEGKAYLFQKVDGYVVDGVLYWILSEDDFEETIYNVYLLEPGEGMVYFNGYYFAYESEYFEGTEREQIADLMIGAGRITSIDVKTDKISGKLLSCMGVNDDGEKGSIELEGIGNVLLSDHVKIYDIRTDLLEGTLDALPIGYDFCDYVIKNDVIEAILIARSGEMDHIRVLLRGPNLEGRFYEELSFVSDAPLTVYAPGEDSFEVAANETICFNVSDYVVGTRILLKESVITQKTRIKEVLRSQGNASYRGEFEISVTSDGFVVINELALEEYLFAVVPSEMPSSYPAEALKAQAICARTYAYMNMVKAAYPKYGAHVDDSAAYQVYQNISENVNTTQAVKNTKGQMLYYQNNLAQTYYYSTSAGFGNSVEVWNGRSESEFPYMTSIHYGTSDSHYSPTDLMDNAVYDEYIKQVDPLDFEASEGWYRWTYSPKEISSDVILERLKARYGMNSNLVLTKNANGDFVSKEIGELGDIADIEITERLPGGNVKAVVITGTKGCYKVLTELYIRAVLCDGETKVVRQSGDEVAMPSLLPSGFISLEIEKIDGIVVQYKIYGGGFGHGVGMSQNGAKAMANMGYSTSEILQFYYQGCEIKEQNNNE